MQLTQPTINSFDVQSERTAIGAELISKVGMQKKGKGSSVGDGREIGKLLWIRITAGFMPRFPLCSVEYP